MPFIHIASSIPMLISVKVSSQFQAFTVMSISNFYDHVNFKPQRSYKFQTPTVMSINFKLSSQYHPFLLSAKWLVRIQEQLVPVNLLLLSAKRLVRIQEQLVPVNSLLLSVKWPVRIQEQLVPVNLLSFSL